MSGNLIIKTRPSRRNKGPIAVLVGKNVIGLAVKRNLLKRRIRSVLAHHAKGTGLGFTVIAKPPSANASFKGIREEILDYIGKIKK